MKFGIRMLSAVFAIFSCLSQAGYAQEIKGWNNIGDATWKLVDGVIQSEADGKGFLVTNASYTDFKLTIEFWNAKTFSGVFLRCSDPKKIHNQNSYKVSISRNNPANPDFTTGGISGIAKPSIVVDTFDKWNTYEITAKGNHIIVKLNGVETVNIQNDLFKSGPIALQSVDGITKFKNIVIKPL